MNSYEYGPLAGDEEVHQLATIEALSFGHPIDAAARWITSNQPLCRVIRQDGAIVGGLLLIPMGQFFGGASVPTTGVAGVAVAPHLRGRGVAGSLMRSALLEMRKQGAAVSTLYPATYGLYRRMGYELGGAQYRIRLPMQSVGITDRGLEVRPYQADDRRAVERLYRAHAMSRQGWLDRAEYIWNRVINGRGDAMHGYVITSGAGRGEIEGYVFYFHEGLEPMGFNLHVTDMVCASEPAARRLFGFLADHGAQARSIVWKGGVDEPLLGLLPERGYQVDLAEPWMLRIVDVSRALCGRGYPQGLRARLELRVSDEVMRGQGGRYVLEVDGGKAAVRKGGRGTLELSARALAQLYTGYATPYQLAALGTVSGPSRALATAAAIFPGAASSLRDFF